MILPNTGSTSGIGAFPGRFPLEYPPPPATTTKLKRKLLPSDIRLGLGTGLASFYVLTVVAGGNTGAGNVQGGEMSYIQTSKRH